MHRGPTCAALLALTLAALTGCTATDEANPPAASPGTTSGSPSATTPTAPATPSPSGTPAAPTAPATPPASPAAAPHPVSVPALIAKQYAGGTLRLGRVLDRNSAYTRYAVTYPSGSLTISGILNVPRTPGRHPALVLNHGYIDPAVYTTGRGLRREQDYLARRGYVVLHTDYRNHAQSSDDPRSRLDLNLGYAEDAINAVLALRTSASVDPERIGMLGRSMGGGVTLNSLVARPGLVKAGVLYASVSSETADNFNQFNRGDGAAARAVLRAYGEPAANPGFWRNASSRPFFGRITEPVLIHHGTADSTCPPAWANETLNALRAAGKDATLHTYPGEEHAFGPAWETSMERSVAFLRQQGV